VLAADLLTGNAKPRRDAADPTDRRRIAVDASVVAPGRVPRRGHPTSGSSRARSSSPLTVARRGAVRCGTWLVLQRRP